MSAVERQISLSDWREYQIVKEKNEIFVQTFVVHDAVRFNAAGGTFCGKG
jgi:hypothetical protein